jgi:hypothetical protein
MPPDPAGIAVVFERYRALMDRLEAAARAASDVPGPCGGCHGCCGPLLLLPLEACALLDAGVIDGRTDEAAACPLLVDGRCRADGSRPFACRARGLAFRRLDADGEWFTGSCALAGGDGRRQAPAPLAEWAAQLFHLDVEFRRGIGGDIGRVSLAELCRAPERYRTLLSREAGRPLASRVVT